MARPQRLEFPGAIYHVTSRGNEQHDIFADQEDRNFFLAILAKVAKRFNWICHAYCLMDNHYHLVVETLDGKLSIGMRQLNGIYTQNFNLRHRLDGPVMQGRFKAVLVERDGFLLEMCRHVVMNPVRTRTVKLPEKYLWSSFRATAGIAHAPPFLSTDWVLRQFGKQKKTAERRYQEFVMDGHGTESPWVHLRKQILLGSEEFVAQMAALMNEAGTIREFQLHERRTSRPTLNQLFSKARDRPQRNAAIRLAHLTHLYSLNEIGNFVGLHFATVSKIANAATEE
ncbi:MAG TPA: transposase [Burkholderiaceae bacterium]|jgi:REP element-mobilizing transposase RayT